MGDSLDKGQPEFHRRDLALEQNVKAADRTARFLFQRIDNATQCAVMIVDQLLQARRQPGEGQLVPGRTR